MANAIKYRVFIIILITCRIVCHCTCSGSSCYHYYYLWSVQLVYIGGKGRQRIRAVDDPYLINGHTIVMPIS